jgi:hypothetical protein
MCRHMHLVHVVPVLLNRLGNEGYDRACPP